MRCQKKNISFDSVIIQGSIIVRGLSTQIDHDMFHAGELLKRYRAFYLLVFAADDGYKFMDEEILLEELIIHGKL
ncbi:hypothetical protein D3C86_1742330 [compost metagenome]